ncbi:hypothetical protein ZIOFF_007073 [Zingiber officinale]|uniref:O-fucosyltransferase family protein n=2 Tax=Zingiber officinale TaxID=94328 RepID=A0A8J5HWJ7_ZINOF|nr:hypothetical protein ZIOFF_007073 [Zingiber officinale]
MSISLLYREADDDSMDKSLKSNITKTLSLTDKVWLILRSTSFKGQHVVQSTLRTCQSGKLMIRGFLSFNSRRKVCPFDIQTSNSVLSPRSVAKDNNKGSDECKTPRAHLTNETLQSPELEEEAAIRLQKVYRSFRTRRQLADCAIIVEQQWWKVIDFALLEQSSVLFFDLQKQESAVSRWSRARTRAAKVGKGLSKDEKAQKLALQHWLEAIDPRHRYGHNLHFYYDHWLQCFCGQPFFYWLDVGEGKEINLQEQCHRQKLQQQCIMYLGPKKKGRFQHSSFLAGGATSAAGRLVIEHGILKAVWPHSGHYRPTNANFQEFMSFLQQHGVDIADIRTSPIEGEEDVCVEPITKSSNPSLVDSTTEEIGSNRPTDLASECNIDNKIEVTEEAIFQVGENDEKAGDSAELIHRRMTRSCQLGKKLSFKWATGTGPRILCVREYPTEIQFRALEQVSLSPRENGSPRTSPRIPPIQSPANEGCNKLSAVVWEHKPLWPVWFGRRTVYADALLCIDLLLQTTTAESLELRHHPLSVEISSPPTATATATATAFKPPPPAPRPRSRDTMKDPGDGVAAERELPVSQKAIKVLSNVCFSAFVLFVLVFTVVAITYQPPDPWFDSPKAIISKSLAATLPNATFRTDDSVLRTGEDLASSPSPNDGDTLSDASDNAADTFDIATASPDPTDNASAPDADDNVASVLLPKLPPSSADCDSDAPINCSDPRALSAIRRFNARIFRRSIIFVSYEKPVPGSSAGECDASWRFRNRLEKSWRRYRDYRRFRLAVADNCSYKVIAAGKFHSGSNAAPKPLSSPRRSSSPAPPAQITDAEINDTIPTLGSESDFRKGKYLYYTRGGDYCKGMNQYLWSFLCGLGEAQFLNRTLVLDLNICLPAAYNPSGRNEEGKDFRFYFDFEHLKESAFVVEENEFLRDWQRWEKKVPGRKGGGKITVRKVPTYKVTPMQLKKDKSTIIWRQFEGREPENYWYRVCEGRAAKFIQRPWHSIWKSKRLMNIVSQIAGRMDWDYDAVHVIRGEKARNKQLWPNLDADTSPGALVQKLTKMIHEWRNLYIATNEPFYNYFDKLRSHYKVHLLDDFKDLWGNTSEWYNETLSLNNGRPVEFDGYMRVAVDTEVLYRAKNQVETFNNLTRDCKDGINTC